MSTNSTVPKGAAGSQPSTGGLPPVPTSLATGAAAAALHQSSGSPSSPPPVRPSASSSRRARRKKWCLKRWVGFKKAARSFWDYFCKKAPKRALVFFILLLAGLVILLGTVYKDEFLKMMPTHEDQAILVSNTSLVIGATLISILLWWKATRKLCFSLIAFFLLGWLVLKVGILLWNFLFVPTGWRVKYSDVTESRYTPWPAPAEERTTGAPPTPTPAKQAEATPAPVVVAEHSPSGLITHGRFDPVQGNIYTVICDPGGGKRIEIEFFQRIDEPGEAVQRWQKCTTSGYKDVPLAEAKNSFAKATKIEWSKIGEPPKGGDVRKELAPSAAHGSKPRLKAAIPEKGGPDDTSLFPTQPGSPAADSVGLLPEKTTRAQPEADLLLPASPPPMGGEVELMEEEEVAPAPPQYELDPNSFVRTSVKKKS